MSSNEAAEGTEASQVTGRAGPRQFYWRLHRLAYWNGLRKLARIPFMWLSALIPLVGYIFLLLWSEAHTASGPNETLGSQMLRPILLAYFGFSLLGVGSIVFWIRCPAPVLRYSHSNLYIQAIATTFTDHPQMASYWGVMDHDWRQFRAEARGWYLLPQFEAALTELAASLDQPQRDEKLRIAMFHYFHFVARVRPKSRLAVLTSFLLGFGLLLVASFEAVIRVVTIAV